MTCIPGNIEIFQFDIIYHKNMKRVIVMGAS